MMNPQGTVENKNALHSIQRRGIMTALPSTPRVQTPYACFKNPPGPHAFKQYTFLYGGEDQTWIKHFDKKGNVVVEDPDLHRAKISIELSYVENSRKRKRTDHWNQAITDLVLSFKNKGQWFILTKASTLVAFGHGATVLNVLEEFEEWKKDLHEKRFEICFKEHHDKLIQTRDDLPLISWNDEQFLYH